MKYFEETGYNKDQNKKDITWEEVKNLPMYVMTDAGNLWHGENKVSVEEAKKPCYIVNTSSRDVALYFFEKATLGEMTGVKLHLMQEEFYKAKKIYAPCLNKEHWVFITPDWKTYDMEGKPIKIKELTYFNESYAPSHRDFDTFRTNAHDLRIIGQFDDRISSEQMLSPASVEILKEAGFDMDTKMMTIWQMKYSGIPEDSYLTDCFVENLIHPNRVARRKKENSSIKHDYKYYCDLMGEKNFLIFEEEGQIYVAQKSIHYRGAHDGITVSYLKMQNRKEPLCVYYSDNGVKKLKSNTIESVLDYEYDYDTRTTIIKGTCINAIDQLLDKRQMLEKTEVFKNLIPILEKAKKDLNHSPYDQTQKIYGDLTYILSPVGQKDRVFEETIKQNGLGKGMKAESFLRIIGDYSINPSLKKKTPYGQVELTKPVYYGLRKLIDKGVSIDLRSIVKGLTNGGYYITKEEYLAKRSELCPYLTVDFLNLLGDTMSAPHNRTGMFFTGFSAESWGLLLRLTGKSSLSPLPEKMAAVTRLLKKCDSDTPLPAVIDVTLLRDYYRQVDELAPLGIDWPQKYEEFHVKNIMWFLGTIRGYSNLVNSAKNLIPSASFRERIEILHGMQNQISALNRLEIEKAALEQMDKEYAPWKEQLKKALEWKDQNVGIFIPESLAELTMEGKILHHCVGSYKKDVALRKEGILFLRKLSCPDTPYYTLDVVKEPNGKYTVRQCHGNCNSNPTPEVIEALKKWAADTGKVDESSIKDDYRALCCL